MDLEHDIERAVRETAQIYQTEYEAGDAAMSGVLRIAIWTCLFAGIFAAGFIFGAATAGRAFLGG